MAKAPVASSVVPHLDNHQLSPREVFRRVTFRPAADRPFRLDGESPRPSMMWSSSTSGYQGL